MKYAIIRPTDMMGTKVIASTRFAWLARLIAARHRIRYPNRKGIEVVEVHNEVQEVVDICDHRQKLSDRLDEAQRRIQALEALFQQDVSPAVAVLYGLVSRDEEGRWTTVHDVDTYVGDDYQAILDEVLA